MNENELSFKIRRCVFKVYNALGPGLLESAYEAVLSYKLKRTGLTIDRQIGLPMVYENLRLDVGYRIDIIVENKVLIEVKSIETLLEVHHKQVITYLKLSGIKLGLLVNFNTSEIDKSIFRKVNGL